MKSFLHSVHLKDCPGPLQGDQYIELHPNINVFYGLNGSGKTSLIRTIVAGLKKIDFKKDSEFKDYSHFADFFFPILKEKEDFTFTWSYRDDDRWDHDVTPSRFTHIYKVRGPHFLDEIKVEYSISVIGYPPILIDDNYIFPIEEEFNENDCFIKKDKIDFWLQGNPLIHLTRIDSDEKMFEISVVHVKDNMNLELKSKWDNLINLFFNADKKAQELIPEEGDDWIEKQTRYVHENALVKVIDSENVFLNQKNWPFRLVSEGSFNPDKKFIFLPTLGYLKHSKCSLIYEQELFKDDEIEKKIDIHALTILSNYGGDKLIDKVKSIESESISYNKEVNEIYSRLLYGAPQLVFAESHHIDPQRGNIFSWYIKDPSNYGIPKLDLIPIEMLSKAELRWALLSIEIAIQIRNRPKWVYADHFQLTKDLLIIDEPESALHITAQQHLVEGLKWLSEEKDFQIFLSTHSPLFMNFKNGKLFEVRKEEKGSKVYQLNQVLRNSMIELGIEPVDLLRQIKAFLIVEGQHEIDILTELFGDELEKNNVHLLPLRGAKNLSSIVNSSFIFDFSDAKIITLLDNLDLQQVSKVWQEAIDLCDRGAIDEGKNFILKNLPAGERIENKFLREFMIRALEESVQNRVTLFGLSKKDIIQYLPSNNFVPNSNWNNLMEEFNNQNKIKDLKSYLTNKYNTNFSSESLKNAVKQMDNIHEDLTNLLNHIENNIN